MAEIQMFLYKKLSYLPGRIGRSFENKWYWAQHKNRTKSSLKSFENALSRLKPGSVYLDLGANVGKVSEKLLDRGCIVHSFEPDPWAFSQLKERIGSREGANLYNKAVGVRTETRRMSRHPEIRTRGRVPETTSFFDGVFWKANEAEHIEVEVVSLVDLIEGIGCKIPFMKMDIEGAEVEVLESFLDHPAMIGIGDVFVETHEAQIPSFRSRTAAIRARLGLVCRAGARSLQ